MALSRRPDARGRQLANLRNAPPAPLGNQRAVRHGGYAEVARERLDERTRRIFDELAVDAPLRDEAGELPAADHLIVSLLAQALERLERVATYLSLYGVLDETTGIPRPAAEYERRLRGDAADYARELGLSPRARASLGLDLLKTQTAHAELEAHVRGTYGEDGAAS